MDLGTASIYQLDAAYSAVFGFPPFWFGHFDVPLYCFILLIRLCSSDRIRLHRLEMGQMDLANVICDRDRDEDAMDEER